MREELGDIWSKHEQGFLVGITTNGFVKSNGECVMGRGTAFQAKQRFPAIATELGTAIKQYGNHVYVWPNTYRVFSFPVKHAWWQKADLDLIARSCQELMSQLKSTLHPRPIYLPRPGCGNGQLEWRDVAEVISPILSDDVVVMTNGR